MAYQYDIDPSWVDSIEDGDYDSAARLYLEAKRDAYSPHSKRMRSQQALATIRALDIRFPGVAEHAATATAEELSIVGDRSMRQTHEAERGTTGLSRRDRRRSEPRDRKDKIDPEIDMATAILRTIKLAFYAAFWPWTAIIKHRAKIAAHFRSAPAPPPEEEIPF